MISLNVTTLILLEQSTWDSSDICKKKKKKIIQNKANSLKSILFYINSCEKNKPKLTQII